MADHTEAGGCHGDDRGGQNPSQMRHESVGGADAEWISCRFSIAAQVMPDESLFVNHYVRELHD